jgi:hypothetical protein
MRRELGLFFILSITLISCHQKTKTNEFTLIKDVSLKQAGLTICNYNVLFNDGQSRIDLFLSSNKYQLLDGYMFCNLDSAITIDTSTLKIQSCNDHLYRDGDTIEIYYKPNKDTVDKYGYQPFSPIVILFKDKDKALYYISDTLIDSKN